MRVVRVVRVVRSVGCESCEGGTLFWVALLVLS